MNKYNDPLFIDWNRNSKGEPHSVALGPEEHEIVKNKIYLNQIPDEFYRVHIPGMTEVKTGIKNNTQFRVDYANGEITFHPSLNKKTVKGITYYGRGVILYPASRIYTHIDDLTGAIKTLADVEISLGESAEILENLQKSLDQALKDTQNLKDISADANSVLNNLKSENKKAQSQIKSLKELTDKGPGIITALESATNKANSALDKLTDLNAQATENRKILELIYNDIVKIEKTVEEMLNASVELESKLQKLIEEGENLYTNLTENINSGKEINSTLEDTIQRALEVHLDLENIIEGTDYKVLLDKVKELEETAHSHSNLEILDGLEEKDGELLWEGKPIGKGDMQSSVYDPMKTGVVSRARDSEMLGGVQAEEYVTKDESLDLIQSSETLKILEEQGFIRSIVTWGDFLKEVESNED